MVPLESWSIVAYSLSMGLSCIVPEIKRDIDRKSQFLSRISTAILTRDIDVAIPSVCPSVRLSVCPSVRLSVCHVAVSKRLNISSCAADSPSTYGSPIILVLSVVNVFAKFRRVGYINFTFFCQIGREARPRPSSGHNQWCHKCFLR